MNKAPVLCVLAFCIVSSHRVLADDYIGADSVLSKASAASGELEKKSEAENPVKILRSDLKVYGQTSASLPPGEAAARWLELADRLAQISPDVLNRPENRGDLPDDPQSMLGLGSLVAFLPPPAAWDALVKALEERPVGEKEQAIRTRVLRILGYLLTNQPAKQEKELAELQAIAAKLTPQYRQNISAMLYQIQRQLLEHSTDGKTIVAVLEKQIEIFGQGRNEYGGLPSLEVPELVPFVGADATATLLKKALKADGLEVSINSDAEETGRLARKVALQMIGELKRPQWRLAESLEAGELFEAMEKRFSKPANAGNPDNSRQTAAAFYLLHLIQAQRTKDAVAFAGKMGSEAGNSLPSAGLDALERAGYTKAVSSFLHGLLEQNPNLPYWDDYVRLAPKADQGKEMLALAEAAARRENLSPKQRRTVWGVLAHAYLATDDVGKGVGLMRKQIASSRIAGTGPDESSLKGSGAELAKLGLALERPELVDEGIAAMRDSISQNSPDQRWNTSPSTLQEIAEVLIKANRGPEAEAVLTDALARLQQTPREMGPNYTGTRRALSLLLGIYHKAGRPADVLALLDRAPYWGAKDLKDFYLDSVTIDQNEDYVGYFAASALAAAGRKPEALRMVEVLLDEKGSYDPAYELLIQLEPETAAARLDALFARDPFEERPLIWKARILLATGKLDEAEKCARQAISIDPTDGEQGPGRRLRAYATLGEIREARGDAKEAGFLKEVLTSVRHSDKADRLHEAGLITRAMKLYEESLTHFADAYCIQARLAFRKAELGDLAGAEVHYRRAYELMPDSFGRVESYCFGCEGAFQGAQAQGIAEKVFKKIAEKSPEKPQIHYLLGYLYHEQERYPEAVAEYRKAVKIDPDYLNAWKKLADSALKARVPATEYDEIQFNIIRLDPLGRHSDFDFDRVSDLRAAWTAQETAAKARKPLPVSLYPLAASSEAMQRQQEEAAKSGRSFFTGFSSFRFRDQTPGQRTANKPVINQLNNFYEFCPGLFR